MTFTYGKATSTLAIFLCGLISLSNSMAADIKSYSAKYSANFNGMEIEADHRLEQLESGQFQQTLKAKNIFGKIDERALFSISENQQIVPLEYSYERSLLGKKRIEKQVFDWPNQELRYSKKNKVTSLPLQSGYLDIVTQKLQLRLDLQSGKETLSYPVISRGKLKQYDFKIIASEVLETAIGPLNTVLVQRVREDNQRQTKIWLATDWDYLAVRLEQVEDGDSNEMNIINGEVNNQPVQPLKIATEK